MRVVVLRLFRSDPSDRFVMFHLMFSSVARIGSTLFHFCRGNVPKKGGNVPFFLARGNIIVLWLNVAKRGGESADVTWSNYLNVSNYIYL